MTPRRVQGGLCLGRGRPGHRLPRERSAGPRAAHNCELVLKNLAADFECEPRVLVTSARPATATALEY